MRCFCDWHVLPMQLCVTLLARMVPVFLTIPAVVQLDLKENNALKQVISHSPFGQAIQHDGNLLNANRKCNVGYLQRGYSYLIMRTGCKDQWINFLIGCICSILRM